MAFVQLKFFPPGLHGKFVRGILEQALDLLGLSQTTQGFDGLVVIPFTSKIACDL